MRLTLLLGLAALTPMLAITTSAHAASYTIDKWEDDFYRVPCKAWAKNKDGSWTQTGTIYIASGGEVSGRTFISGREWATINNRCKGSMSGASKEGGEKEGGGEH